MLVPSRIGALRAALAVFCLTFATSAASGQALALTAPSARATVDGIDSALAALAAARNAKPPTPDDSLRGRSGKLLMRLVTRARATLALPLFARLFGDSAVEKPGLYFLSDSLLA